MLGDEVLAAIARDLVRAIRADMTVDWAVREQVQAKLRSKVKRLLARHGYPPDAETRAVELVLKQTKTFAEEWAASIVDELISHTSHGGAALDHVSAVVGRYPATLPTHWCFRGLADLMTRKASGRS